MPQNPVYRVIYHRQHYRDRTLEKRIRDIRAPSQQHALTAVESIYSCRFRKDGLLRLISVAKLTSPSASL